MNLQIPAIPNYIAYAIPGFFLLIAIELIVAWLRNRKLYRFNDSITDLSLGIYSRIFGGFYAVFLFLVYVLLHRHLRVFTLPVDSVWTWIFGFFAVDFSYYWFHRTSHEVAVVWGSHAPHHQSEEYNLSVALRQGSFQGVFSFWFSLPWAILGLDPIVYGVMSQFNTLYQFWVHTRLVGKLGILEYVFVTPSNHRVHHGINPEYIDRNHGGVLIIWDRLFGTYAEEQAPVVYGTVKPLASWNPMWATIEFWLHLARLSGATRKFRDKVRVWFANPGWRPDDLGGPRAIPEVQAATYKKWDTQVGPFTIRYAILQFLVSIAAAVTFIFMGDGVFGTAGVSLALYVLSGLMFLGWLLEGRRDAWAYEVVRIIITLAWIGSSWSPGVNMKVAAFGAVNILLLVVALAGLSGKNTRTSENPVGV